MITMDQVQKLLSGSGTVVGDDGSKIGKIGQVFLDDQSGEPEWVTVNAGGGESFVPLAHASATGEELTVPYGKDKVEGAPMMKDSDTHISEDQEAKLHTYYGIGGGQASKDQKSVGHDTSGPNTDQAMTRSEEQLKVGTESRESGTARLRKFVVTENVTTTVPVSREEIRVTSEPITDANRGDAMAGGDITSEEHEVTLHEETAVVTKETVPVERVRMDVETVTENQQVTEEVRKEQIETEMVDVRGEKSEPRK